jgi:low affinity Fe/Cu permease
MHELFRRFAQRVSSAVGTPWAFVLALLVILAWALTGPLYHYSDTWQLVINTGTTIVTFLMVFLIQNTQNRDAAVFHLKLDELIRAVKTARNELVDMEHLSDEELHQLQKQFEELGARAAKAREGRRARTGRG